ncbi:hypothetical protein K443DRAFT_15452 [Laccaria amethystina LaAM-08-1]|uniref:NACHT domain-containing protein n=1 Tax=Laccaria amethystina LaAM-08-1 TaxID=1095629 RepID=A0A0C9WXP1_9AGAR|nr:hypothetical protein K443DRAFT_15452 [Laccaria amethystina LaAM-08-1]
MAKHNSQSSKQSKPSSRFNIFKRPISPASSDQNQGWSLKLPKLFRKSRSTTPTQSTSSLPLVSSTVDSHGETALEPSIATTPSGHPTLAPLPASFSVVQDQLKPSAQQAALTTTSLDQSHGLVSNPPENRQTAPKPGSSIKDILGVTGRAITTLAKRLPDIADPNPVKVALGLVKLIIEIQQAVADNMDTVKRRLNSTRAQLETVEKELDGWTPKTAQERQCINSFILTLIKELKEFEKLGDEWFGRKIVNHEAEKGRITEIFERINEAREQFKLAINIRVFKGVNEIEIASRTVLLDRLERLKPSKIAHYKYDLEGEEERHVRRVICTPGTRVRILDDIITWANNTSPGSPDIYWLFGQAGSGKSTIAYSVARRFESAVRGDSAF